jgi:hypothetical protein
MDLGHPSSQDQIGGIAMQQSGRGVGYCVNSACGAYLRGRVLAKSELAHFLCPRCGYNGRLELERGVRSGRGGRVTEVRVEYGYDALRGIYTESTVVHGDSRSSGGAVYTLQSPLIQTADTAIAVARTILARLDARAAQAPRPAAPSLAPRLTPRFPQAPTAQSL